jgi:2-dehydropantoate 2-reductase
MRFLIVGAGALGGYFGGRLLQQKQDVRFLVRPRRAAELASDGLVIQSPAGDAVIPHPPHLLAAELKEPFDVIVVGCKAYDLAQTMEDFAPGVGAGTAILPLLNGMRHLDQLDARFGADQVLGGQCLISATLDARHRILHLSDIHTLGFGERGGGSSARVEAIAAACAGALFEARPSTEILQDMWEKWVFIASAAGITCLMRGTIGDIVEGAGAEIATQLFEECSAVASRAGFAPRKEARARGLAFLTAAGSPISASMLKDVEKGGAVEADHILGDLLDRGQGVLPAHSLLRTAYVHLKTYEARRRREAAAPPTR